ncbi:nucleotide-diphospho-sugar transferase [Aspergillus aurantiobrunneus]
MPRYSTLKSVTVLTSTVIGVLIVLFFFHPLQNFWRFSSPDSNVEAYNFLATADEVKCFSSINGLSNPIPNVVHFISGIENPEMNFITYLAIRSALVSLQPDTLKLHYEELNMDNIWLQKLRDNITLVHHDVALEYPKQKQENWQASHLADMLRLDILRQEGGIYLDTDVIALQSFDAIRYNERGVLLGNEGGDRHGLCNAVIVARKDASFLQRWIESYKDFSPDEWNYHSVLLPKKMALDHPDQVCSLAPTAFFWPTWTTNHIRYMHEAITEDEARQVEELLDVYGGGLHPNQLAYHAWNQVARTKYLEKLTPDVVRQKDTRFNIMVRRFL